MKIQKLVLCMAISLLAAAAIQGQAIDPKRGTDPKVDYASLTKIGPWDDRNYSLTRADLDLLLEGRPRPGRAWSSRTPSLGGFVRAVGGGCRA